MYSNFMYVSVMLMIRSQEEREQRRCRLAAVQEKRQCLETEVKELAAQSRRHASDLNAIRAKLKHLIEQRDTIIGYCIFCRMCWIFLDAWGDVATFDNSIVKF